MKNMKILIVIYVFVTQFCINLECASEAISQEFELQLMLGQINNN